MGIFRSMVKLIFGCKRVNYVPRDRGDAIGVDDWWDRPE